MALKGTLRDFSLADILQLIGIQRKTGVLTLKSDRDVATVSFVEGQVVAADSLHRRLEDRLGTVLVKTGKITEAQLQEVLRIQKTTLKRMGNVLVENRFIDERALRDALQIQVAQLVYRLFRWRDGEYNFSQEERVEYDKEHITPMSAESLLMEGARILDEWPMIEKAIRSFSAIYRRTSVEIHAAPTPSSVPGEEPARGVTLSDEERAVIALVDGRRTVQEVVERSSLGEFETCRILFDLIGRQLVEEVKVGPAKAPLAAAPSPVALRTQPSLLAGACWLVLIASAAAALMLRAGPMMAAWQQGERLGACLAPLIAGREVEEVRAALAQGRLQRIDFALQVYYLLNRGYPADLRNLVTSRLLRADALLDPWGKPYRYEVTPEGYRLSAPAASSVNRRRSSSFWPHSHERFI